jgi:hypothetical protein
MTAEKKVEKKGDGRDYDKYAYFQSKARNYGVVYEPRVEEITASGDRRVAKDDDGKQMTGIRIEFHNFQKRIERTPENKKMIEWLEARCKKELTMPLRFQQISQIFKPEKIYKQAEVDEMMDDKDAEIARLKAEMGKDEAPAPAPATEAPADTKEETEEKEALSKVI